LRSAAPAWCHPLDQSRLVFGADILIEGVLDKSILTGFVLPDSVDPRLHGLSNRGAQSGGCPGICDDRVQRLQKLGMFRPQLADSPFQARLLLPDRFHVTVLFLKTEMFGDLDAHGAEAIAEFRQGLLRDRLLQPAQLFQE
jgi:hypothetical protein